MNKQTTTVINNCDVNQKKNVSSFYGERCYRDMSLSTRKAKNSGSTHNSFCRWLADIDALLKRVQRLSSPQREEEFFFGCLALNLDQGGQNGELAA